MERPLREQIRFNDRWHARSQATGSVEVFVPWPWHEKRVRLHADTGEPSSGVRINETELTRSEWSGEWEAGPAIRFGEWNRVELLANAVQGASLEAGEQIQIVALEATVASEHSLSVRVRLSHGDFVTLLFTLASSNGQQIGVQEVTVGRKTTDLTVEMPLRDALKPGTYRLKATLSVYDRVVDNARTDVIVEPES